MLAQGNVDRNDRALGQGFGTGMGVDRLCRGGQAIIDFAMSGALPPVGPSRNRWNPGNVGQVVIGPQTPDNSRNKRFDIWGDRVKEVLADRQGRPGRESRGRR